MQEDENDWTNHKVVEWFDRIPDEYLGEHWPQILGNIDKWYASLAASRARKNGDTRAAKKKATEQSNAARQRRIEKQGVIIPGKRLAKDAPAKSTGAVALVAFEEHAAVVTLYPDMSAALAAMLATDMACEAMASADMPTYLTGRGVTRVAKRGAK